MTESTPITIESYVLLEKIAQGEVTQTNRAKIIGDGGIEKIVVVKKILPQFSGQKGLVKAFVDEIKFAALLKHPNIVRIHDFGLMENSFYFTMEFLLGKDLRHIFRKSQEKGMPLSLGTALCVTSQVCAGLEHAHRLTDFQGTPLQIIHGDVSPPNIFVTYEGEVKIIDFGMARAATIGNPGEPMRARENGAYNSPEQATGEEIDHRSDIFATGTLLYEMVSHKKMYPGPFSTLLARVRQADFEPPEKAASGLSPKLYGVLHKALAKERDQRYQSCGEMLAALEECSSELSERTTPQGVGEYMKELFLEEIEAEGGIFKEAITGGLDPEKELKSDLTVVEGILEKAKNTIEEKEPPKGKSEKVRHVALVFVLAVLFVFWASDFRNNLMSEPDGEALRPPISKPPRGAGLEEVFTPEDTLERKERIEPLSKSRVLLEKAAGLAERNPQEAQSLLLKVIELDPKNGRAYFHLGSTYMAVKDSSRAVEAFRKAIELAPNFPDAHFNLGYIYALKNDYSKAEEMYTQVVRMAPPYLDEALFNLGLVQERQGKKEESIKNVERALQVNPQNQMAQKLLRKLKGDS